MRLPIPQRKTVPGVLDLLHADAHEPVVRQQQLQRLRGPQGRGAKVEDGDAAWHWHAASIAGHLCGHPD